MSLDIWILAAITLCQAGTGYWAFHVSVNNNNAARWGFAAITVISLTLIVWSGIRNGRSSDMLNNNIVGIKASMGQIASAANLNPNQSASDLAAEIIKKLPQPKIPTAAAITQQVVDATTNAHLQTSLYINNFTAPGGAVITLVATNSGNAPIEINRIEATSGGMIDDENNVGFERVLQPGGTASKIILLSNATSDPPALTIAVLYKGVENGKSKNLLNTCRFDVNKTSPIKIEIYPMDCQESTGDNFIQTEESQEKSVTFNTADKPEGTIEFILPEVAPNGLPNVFSFSTASKFFVFNPIKDFAVFVCADGRGAPKILTEKFNENPSGNHNHQVLIIWNDKTGESSLEVDGKTKTIY